MSAPKFLRPGDAAPETGLYEIVEIDNTRTGVIYAMHRTMTLPPTFRKNQRYVKLGPIPPDWPTAKRRRRKPPRPDGPSAGRPI